MSVFLSDQTKLMLLKVLLVFISRVVFIVVDYFSSYIKSLDNPLKESSFTIFSPALDHSVEKSLHCEWSFCIGI